MIITAKFGSNHQLWRKWDLKDIYSSKIDILSSKKGLIPVNCLFVLRFYGPVNPVGSCRARSLCLTWGWSGGAKVLCILHHWGVQLILAYSWARPAILVVGKGRGGMFLFLLFLHFHSCSYFFPVPLFHLRYSLFYLFSPFLWETTQNDPQGLTCR